MKKFLPLIFLCISFSIQSQELIKGKLFTSEDFKEQFSVITTSVQGFIERDTIDKNGIFTLKIEKVQPEYLINFYINDSIVKTYIYKHDWVKRKRPKSISFSEECDVISESVRKDWKDNTLKLYLLQDKELCKKDIKIQNKYNFNYTSINKKNINKTKYDCYRKYNHRALKYLILGKGLSLKKVNKNTIGKNTFYLNKP